MKTLFKNEAAVTEINEQAVEIQLETLSLEELAIVAGGAETVNYG